MKRDKLLFNQVFKPMKQMTGLIALSLLSIPIGLDAVQAQTTQSEFTELRTEVGFEFEGFRDLNTASVTSTEYIGECPGAKAGSVRTRFSSSTRPPAPGLRVVIKNVTRGMGGDTTPYTDREYDKGRLSEGFFVSPATRHSGKYLAVLDGPNDFAYEIKRNQQVIESGSFSADVNVGTRTVERSAIVSYQDYCVKNVSLSDCKRRDIRTRVVRRCPTS